MEKRSKKKLIRDDGDTVLEANLSRNFEDSLETGEPEVLCLTCGFNCNLVKLEHSETEDNISSSISSFQMMCKVLNVKLTKRQLQTWNFEEERLPLCGECVRRLEMMEELTSKITELKYVFQVGKEKFKKKVKKSEKKFSYKEIYDKDDRYYVIRRQLNQDIVLKRKRLSSSLRSSTANAPPKSPEIETPKEIHIKPNILVLPEHNSEVENIIKLEIEIEESNFVEEEKEQTPFPVINDELRDYSAPLSPVIKVSKRNRKTANDKFYEEERSDDSDNSNSTKNNPQRRKRSKAKDEDYVPDKLSDSGDEQDLNEMYKKTRCITDKVTGNITYLNVSYLKVDGQLICQACHPKQVVGRTQIKVHTIRKHTNIYVCDICGAHRATAHDLKLHHSVSHGKSEEDRQNYRIYCPVCSRPFWRINKKRMAAHQQTHYNAQEKADAIARGEIITQAQDPSRNFQCEDCGKVFPGKYNLKIHKISHSEEHKEMCDVCGKSISKHGMKLHLRAHQLKDDPKSERSLKKFSCTICSKRFYLMSQLKLHHMSHTGERPFVCHLCYKGFARKRSLKLHLDAHQNIRKFKCELCPAAFTSKHHLQRHEITYHEEGAKPKRETFIRRPGHFTKYGKNKRDPPKPPPNFVPPINFPLQTNTTS